MYSIIGEIIGTGSPYLFPCGRAYKLIRNGINVTSSTNPIVLATNTTMVVIDCCTPPPVRLAAHCVSAGGLVIASIISPNPVTAGAALHVIGEIYENC